MPDGALAIVEVQGGDPFVVEVILPAEQMVQVIEVVTGATGPQGPPGLTLSQGWGVISEFGGTGAGDETGVIAQAEASSYTHINLQTKTLQTSVSADSLTKQYFNGRLIARGDSLNPTDVHPFWPAADNELRRDHWKTFRFEWAGAKILWLGTSIVHLGSGVDGYAEQTAKVLGASVSNMAWAGSHMYWDTNFDPYNETQATQELGSLSMTEDDRLRGLAAYPGSGYDDDSPFMPVGGPSTMTCDFRIDQQFDLTPFDTVILDHCHNDRSKPVGTLDPPLLPITAIAKGATTTVTLAGPGLVAVGDGVALEVVGIAKLNHAAGMVTSVAGNNFTLNLDSSGFAGTFTSGNAIKYDRATVAGAAQFLLHYIKNCAIRRDLPEPMIILAGMPSEFTASSTERPLPPIDAMGYGCARALKDVARKWSLPFFDIAYYLDISARDHWYYFPDGVHPDTTETRRVISDYWVQWMRGGAPAPWGESNVILRGGEVPHIDGHAAEYSELFGGFLTSPYRTQPPAGYYGEDFAGGIPGYMTPIGTPPVAEAAPWGSGQSVKCVASGGVNSALSIGLALPQGWQFEFDLYLPNLPPVTAPGIAAATIDLCQFRAPAGLHYVFQLIAAPSWTDVQARVVWFNGPDTDMHAVPGSAVSLKPLIKYRIKVVAVRAGASYQGTVMLFVDNVRVAGPGLTNDAAQPDVSVIILGVNWYNTGNTVTVNLGNLSASTIAVDDYTTRYNGNIVVGAQTMRVVNGIITAVV